MVGQNSAMKRPDLKGSFKNVEILFRKRTADQTTKSAV